MSCFNNSMSIANAEVAPTRVKCGVARSLSTAMAEWDILVVLLLHPEHLDLTRNSCSKACCSNWAKCALEKEDVLQASCPPWRYKLQATAVAKEHINYSFFAYRRRLEWFRIYLRPAMRKLLTQIGHISP